MKLVRVHNPKRLVANKPKGKRKTMKTRRRKTTVRRRRNVRRTRAAVNPRRRRHRRRHNPSAFVARRRTRRAVANPRRRRRHHRRRNPSALRIGQILKDMIYGAGGAIATRTVASVAQGFIPGAFAGNALAGPALQAASAATVVRWLGKKFLGQSQGDIMMLGGLISAGLALADQYLPNIQGQLTGIIRAPVQVAPAVAAGGNGGQLADVYDVVGGMGDVEDVQLTDFGSY